MWDRGRCAFCGGKARRESSPSALFRGGGETWGGKGDRVRVGAHTARLSRSLVDATSRHSRERAGGVGGDRTPSGGTARAPQPRGSVRLEPEDIPQARLGELAAELSPTEPIHPSQVGKSTQPGKPPPCVRV